MNCKSACLALEPTLGLFTPSPLPSERLQSLPSARISHTCRGRASPECNTRTYDIPSAPLPSPPSPFLWVLCVLGKMHTHIHTNIPQPFIVRYKARQQDSCFLKNLFNTYWVLTLLWCYNTFLFPLSLFLSLSCLLPLPLPLLPSPFFFFFFFFIWFWFWSFCFGFGWFRLGLTVTQAGPEALCRQSSP